MDEPWLQQLAEPDRWYSRFHSFMLMGSGRSLLGTVHAEEAEKGGKKRSKKVPGAWDAAARKWAWKKRAVAWDCYQRQLKRQRWQKDHDQVIDEAIAIARHDMLNKAREMSKFPLAVRKVDTGTGVVMIMPARWSFRDIATLTKAAVDLVNDVAGHSEVDELRLIEMGIEAGFFPESVLGIAYEKLDDFKQSLKQAIVEGNFGGSSVSDGKSLREENWRSS